jgi:Zn-dependent protease
LDLIVIRILVLVFSIVVHEVAHGWAALLLGDPTAKQQGRLTLNPLPHIDPMGSIVVPAVLAMFGSIPFGWAKPVPVDVGRLRNPRDDHPKVAAAGPISNLILAFFFAVALGVTVGVAGAPVSNSSSPSSNEFFFVLFQTGIIINVVLAMFNLIPLPPLDGSWIVSRFLPLGLRIRYENLRRFGMLIVIGFMVAMRYTPLGGLFSAGLYAVAAPYFNLAQNVANALR